MTATQNVFSTIRRGEQKAESIKPDTGEFRILLAFSFLAFRFQLSVFCN